MSKSVNHIIHNGKPMAIIIRTDFHREGIEFFTPHDFSQQLAYMSHPAGIVIHPHVHNLVPREIKYTQEVLFIKSGKVRIDFYDDRKKYLESCILTKGDVILLACGGHGLEMIEESEIIEVKQGPYAGETDKIRFKPEGNPHDSGE